MAIKKKIKILREFTKTEFQEIKKEKKQENLEEELEEEPEQNFNSFTDFSSSHRTAPVLKAQEQSKPIEQQLQNVPSNTSGNTDTIKYESAKVYNMPDYGSRQEQKIEVRRDNMSTRQENSVNLGQRQESFRQQMGNREFDDVTRKYQEPIRPMEQEEKRMPFSREDDRRKRKVF